MHLYFPLNNTLLLATYWKRGKCVILMAPATCSSIKIFLTSGKKKKREKEGKTHKQSLKKTKKYLDFFSDLILLSLLSVVFRIVAVVMIVKGFHWLQRAGEAVLKVSKEKRYISLLGLRSSLWEHVLKYCHCFLSCVEAPRSCRF